MEWRGGYFHNVIVVMCAMKCIYFRFFKSNKKKQPPPHITSKLINTHENIIQLKKLVVDLK